MTKWLLSLSAAQTVLLAALGLKVFSIDMALDEKAAHSPAQPQQSAAADPASLTWDNARATSISAEDVRSILREELAALGTQDRPAPAAARPAQPQQTPEQVKLAVNAVDQEINFFRSRGAINDKEMAALQTNIMKLPLTERRAALTQLARALSSGAIDGQM